MGKKIIVFVSSLLFLFICLFNPLLNKIAVTEEISEEKFISASTSPTVSAPIYIRKNSELESFPNKTGNGTYDNPYIIKDLVIDAGLTNSGIRISGTDKHLRIINCTLYNSSNGAGFGGISLTGCANVSIINCSLSYCDSGIWLWSTENITIENCTFFLESMSGITLEESNNTHILNNIFSNSGILPLNSYHTIIEKNNLVNGKPIYYYNNQSGINLNSIDDIGLLLLEKCTNSLFYNLDISDSAGICMVGSNNNSFSNIDVSFSFNGISCFNSDNNSFSDINASYNTRIDSWRYSSIYSTIGILFSNSNYNILSEINTSHNDFGMFLYSSGNNEISGCFVSFNDWGGIFLSSKSEFNRFYNNSISHNFKFGIILGPDTKYNWLWMNYFNNNGEYNAQDNGTQNYWDDWEIGNFWGDYKLINPNSSRSDNIWHDSYLISGTSESKDNFPIVDHPVWDNFPIAKFVFNTTSIIRSKYIQFNFTGYLGITPSNFQWNFGDGTSNSTEINPIHVYNSTGNFTIILTITDFNNDVDIYSVSVTVLEDLIPLANFTVNTTEISQGQWIKFNDISTGGNPPLKYQWNFGDDLANSTDRNPIHQYNSVGNFTVILTVTDADGDTNVIAKMYYIIVQAKVPSTTPGIPGYSFEWVLVFGLIGIMILYCKIQKKDKSKFNSN